LLSWLRHRRRRAPPPEAEAAALVAVRPLSVRSNAGERHALRGDPDVFAHWDLVMRKVAQLTGRAPSSGAGGERPAASPQPEPDLVERLEQYLEQQREAGRKEPQPPRKAPARRRERRKTAWLARRS